MKLPHSFNQVSSVNKVPAYHEVASFFCAVSTGDEGLVRELLNTYGCELANVRLPVRGAAGDASPLYTSVVGMSNEECFDLLLHAGAKVNEVDSTGVSPLMAAAQMGAVTKTEKLLQRGADVHAMDNEGVTVLMCAASSGNKACFEKIFEALPEETRLQEVLRQDADGKRPSHYATQSKNCDIAAFLYAKELEAGLILHCRTVPFIPPSIKQG